MEKYNKESDGNFILDCIGILIGIAAIVLFIIMKIEDIDSLENTNSEDIILTNIVSTAELETVTTDTTTNTTTEIINTTTDSTTTIDDSTTTVETTTNVIVEENIVVVDNDEIYVITKTPEIIITTSPTTLIETTSATTTSTTIGYSDKTYVAKFQGTYYTPYGGQSVSGLKGGSGRELISCSSANTDVIGSIACRYIYEKYGYSYKGNRTKVYLEIPSYPEMNGYYYVDDCCARYDTIDFYFSYTSYCPFEYVGRIYDISCYIVE